MKKISLLVLMFFSLNFIKAQNNLSKAQMQSEISNEQSVASLNIMLSIFEYFDSERISVKTYGSISSSRVSFQTSEAKEKFHSSIESMKKLNEASTFDELFRLISTFTIQSHQVVANEKGYKHYLILGL